MTHDFDETWLGPLRETLEKRALGLHETFAADLLETSTLDLSAQHHTHTIPLLERFAGPFEEALGEGGMSVVHRALQLHPEREVAVKVAQTEADHRSLIREAHVLGMLEHPNIVPVHALCQDEHATPALIMKRVTGTPWSALIANPEHELLKESATPLDFHLQVLTQTCHALDFAHSRGILHRDIKPDNVMVGHFGEVYVVDWGIAVALDPAHAGRLTLVSEITHTSGTPAYMAPEMLDPGVGPVGVQTDVFLLGATLYEILTGHPPHQGANLLTMLKSALSGQRSYPNDAPEDLVLLAENAMALEPSERLASVAEFRHALTRFGQRRESRRLSGEAADILDALTESKTNNSEDNLRGLFTQARFACEQALSTWPENPQALALRRETILRFATHELERERSESAARLLEDLEDPPPELLQRIDEARAATEHASRELQRLRRDADVSVGQRSRVYLMIALAVVSMAVLLPPIFGVEESIWLGVIRRVAILIVLGIGGWLGRKTLMSTAINRRFVLSMMVLIAATLPSRIHSALNNRPMYDIVLDNLNIFVVGSAVIAITVDMRLMWAVACLTAGWASALIWPSTAGFAAALAYVSAFIAAGWIWNRNRDRGSELPGT